MAIGRRKARTPCHHRFQGGALVLMLMLVLVLVLMLMLVLVLVPVLVLVLVLYPEPGFREQVAWRLTPLVLVYPIWNRLTALNSVSEFWCRGRYWGR